MTRASDTAKLLGAGGSILGSLDIGGGQIGGRRNIVINGGMNVAQRGTSETGAGAAEKFVCDRFKLAGTSSGRLTMTQTADGPIGFANCLKLDCTTADTSIAADEYLTVGQAFEGQDLQAIGKGVTGAKQFTVSFYVKASAAFTFGFELYDADNARHNCRLFNTTTDWVRHSFVIQADVDDGSSPFDDDNAASLYFQFWLHGGSNSTSGTLATDWANFTAANRAAGIDSFYSSTNNNFFVTGIQIEVGSVATPFENRSFAEELALCERYFERWNSSGDNESLIAVGYVLNSGRVLANYKYNTPKRVDPTGTNSGASGFSCLRGSWITATGFAILTNKHTARIDLSGLNGFTTGYAAEVRAEGGAGKWFAFDAEL